MDKIDLIIDALQKAKDGWQCFDEYEKALTAARELKALKPVAVGWDYFGWNVRAFDDRLFELLYKELEKKPQKLYALEVTK